MEKGKNETKAVKTELQKKREPNGDATTEEVYVFCLEAGRDSRVGRTALAADKTAPSKEAVSLF